MTEFNVGDTVTTRKPHACGCNVWTVTRTGADYKITCAKCGRTVLLSGEKFHKVVQIAKR